MLTRIGDSAQSDRIASAVRAATSRFNAGQAAAASGKKAQAFPEIATDAGLLLRTKEQRALNQTYLRQNEQVGDRIAAMDGALSGLADIAERMRTLVVQRLDAATGSSVPLDREAEAMLAEASSRLNQKLDGRHLFAGSRTDTAPVVLPDPPPTVADPALYYQGDAVTLAVRADQGVEIDYGVTAAAPALAGLMAAIGKASAAHATNDRGGLDSALAMLRDAVAGVADLRGGLGAAGSRLEAIAEGQRGSAVYLDEVVGRIEDVDIAEALTRVTRDRAGLEAAYLTTSRLSQLSLADFLR